MENEIWKDIPDFEGYMVSNYGRVKSLDRTEQFLNNNGKISIRKRKGTVLKPILSNNGYLVVSLCKKNRYVHRLVALVFLPNPNNYPEVNHKDENKTNNYVDNLEWCSREYNYNYGTRTDRCTKSNTNNPKRCKSHILQYDLEGNFIKEWLSLGDIQRTFNKSISYISACCMGKGNTAYGYIWERKRG